MSDDIGRGADPFPFMKLPTEIRFMVYREHFLQPKETGWPAPLILDEDGKHMVAQLVHIVPLQMLFTVSKCVHEEAVPLYFRTKPFRFTSLGALMVFLEEAGRVCFQNLTSITFTYVGPYAAKAFKILGECPALESVSIIVSAYAPKFDTVQRKRLFMGMPGMKELLKIRGIKNLQVEVGESNILGRIIRNPYLMAPDKEAFVEALQVLKQPQDPAKIKKLLAKLTPKEKAQRRVFGKANVITRAERKVIRGA